MLYCEDVVVGILALVTDDSAYFFGLPAHYSFDLQFAFFFAEI